MLADDHTIVREGFRKILEMEGDLEIVGEARNGREAVALASKLRPMVVLMDIAMPLLNGLLATRQIRKASPMMKVIILSAHSDDAYLDEAQAAGAAGFLIKQSSARDVAAAIRGVHAGREFYSSPPQRKPGSNMLAPRWRNGAAGTARIHPDLLTSREKEVLQLIAEGKANKETASELNISVKTVEKHRQSVMDKLKIHDTAGLTRYAIGAGIVESSVQVTIL